MIDQHYMTASSVFVILFMGFALDWSAFGPDKWQDKIAMLFYTAGIREGFNGGAVDKVVVDFLSMFIDFAKQGGNTYMAGAVSSKVIGGMVGVLFLYTVLCIVPPWKWLEKKIGHSVRINFPKGAPRRLNWPVIAVSAALGLLSDNCGGIVGKVANGSLNGLCMVLGYLPDTLFGG